MTKMLDPCCSSEASTTGDKETIAPLLNNYVYDLGNQQGDPISPLKTNSDSESPTKSANFKLTSNGKLTPPSGRHIPRPGFSMVSRKPSPTKDSETPPDDSIFDLLKQIEDQIADFQADFARLKRASRSPTSFIPRPSSFSRTVVGNPIVPEPRSPITSQPETQTLESRDCPESQPYLLHPFMDSQATAHQNESLP
ncbi:hypothetical protein TWF481_001807 [Arthrobotrys musiformis]|uniref:Uncharacterized protein n=1 Tax=Arthrobotrys musiformis TaxID=47236 RepID=A0AAV9VUK0_9PEZI